LALRRGDTPAERRRQCFVSLVKSYRHQRFVRNGEEGEAPLAREGGHHRSRGREPTPYPNHRAARQAARGAVASHGAGCQAELDRSRRQSPPPPTRHPARPHEQHQHQPRLRQRSDTLVSILGSTSTQPGGGGLGTTLGQSVARRQPRHQQQPQQGRQRNEQQRDRLRNSPSTDTVKLRGEENGEGRRRSTRRRQR